MKILLLCGYRINDDLSAPLGLDVLDARISELQGLGGEVYIVMSGPTADQYLVESKKIHDCELVYDTNSQPSLTTNLRAGLTAVADHNVFVVPVELPVADTAVWKMLLEEGRRVQFSTETDVVQAITYKGAPYHYGFPLFITRQGNKRIQEFTDLQGLIDARLRYLHQVYQHEADLAVPGNPL